MNATCRRLNLRFSILCLVVGVGLPSVSSAQEFRSETRDQGPVYLGTVMNRSWPANSTMKGIVVKLGDNDNDYVAYDEDLLRVSLLWTGAFLNFPNRARERIEHPQPAEVAGIARFGTRPDPGWAPRGNTTDPREGRQGPLPRKWAHYRGLYLNGNRVVLSYDVGAAAVLELPELEATGDVRVFTRTIQIGPTSEPLDLLVASGEAATPAATGFSDPRGEQPEPAVAGSSGSASASQKAAVLYSSGDELTAVQLTAGPAQAQWSLQPGNRIVLQLPALAASTTLKLVHWTGARASWKSFQKAAGAWSAPADLSKLTHGGPARWTVPVVVKGTPGRNAGPYQVDVIAEPLPNPWNTKTFLSALDFFPDGRAAVSTFHGDVWVVSGLDAGLQGVSWKRIASGLFQPLGLKIVAGRIYVTCRDGLVRLQDLNGDGEADFYENFNNDTTVTPNYHEFCLDLDTDSAGNFYYAKGAPWPPTVTSPHQGVAMKVSPDGAQLEIVATGLRAPNGLAVGPHNEISFSDNEGHFIPTSKISYIQPGNLFYGMTPAAHRPSPPSDFEPPICWLPKGIDNSSGGQVWVNSDRWGPLKGSMLFLSYGKASLFSVLQEKVNGRVQGGVVPFPFRFPTGVMRARFSPLDGQLYLTGLRGWQTAGVRDGGFFRVRYVDQPAYWPVGFHARKDGIELTFSSALTSDSLKDPANWGLEQWNYIWSANYGSP